MSKQSQIKAAVIFYSLPEEIRSRVSGLIPRTYLDHLEKINHSGLLKANLDTKIYNDILISLKKSHAGKNINGNIYARIYYFLNLSGAIIALFQTNFVTAMSCFIYSIAGYFYFSSRSTTWLKIRFSIKPFVFFHLLLSIGAYVIILPLTGYLSTEELFRTKEFSLLIQGIILAPLFEEIFFRDLLYTYFKDLFSSDGFSVVFTGIFFSLVHLQSADDISGLAVYFISGCILGFIRAISKNLIYPVVIHSAVNSTLLFI